MANKLFIPENGEFIGHIRYKGAYAGADGSCWYAGRTSVWRRGAKIFKMSKPWGEDWKEVEVTTETDMLGYGGAMGKPRYSDGGFIAADENETPHDIDWSSSWHWSESLHNKTAKWTGSATKVTLPDMAFFVPGEIHDLQKAIEMAKELHPEIFETEVAA